MHMFGMGSQDYDLLIFEKVAIEKGQELEWFDHLTDLSDRLKEEDQAIVFLTHSENHDVYHMCKELLVNHPLILPILCLPREKINLKKVMRSGAVDVIELPTAYPDVINTVSEMIEAQQSKRGQAEQVEKDGKVVTICSTKGGVGKTTITSNLAVAMAKKDLKVAILDLDLQFGDVGLFFDLKPRKTLYEWTKEASPSSPIKSYMTSHSSGVDIMCSPIRPEFSEAIHGGHIESVIERLKKEYDWVVIDTPPSLVETDIVALEHSDEIILVTSMDLPTLKNSKLYLETLESIHLKKPVKVVINKKSKIKGINPDIVQQILEQESFEQIPNDEKNVITAVNEGNPVVISTPRAQVSKSIYSLASKLVQLPKEKKKRKLSKV
ncbi:AAA family ATPase [Aquisalibacillus elongatus]|uniref:Pilus assembly protein CpaE n=1 Tax=Aquisalibacillus elongatus TaxID=485577 RepID=A0A3N5BGC3_9BACI|nr:AAA family ATPase [Aquisalibacillus elongatus]RPF55849.1 pilus assembly protein CpaE [Aquisalibacillus elongatus]